MRDNNAERIIAIPAGSSTCCTATFYEMKQRLLAERTETKAIEVLQNLLSYDTEQIDWDTFPDLKNLIICILDTIVSLTEKHQILVLNGINNNHPKVVDVLADYYMQHIDEVYEMLANSHIAVTIAFARRIHDFDCAGSIAIVLLTRFASLKLVQDELLNQLNTKSAEIRFRIHQVTTLVMKKKDDLHEIDILIRCLAEELKSKDILIQINAVEMFADAVSEKTSTAKYLASEGTVTQLYMLFLDCMQQPDAGFLFPALIKFFGRLAVVNVECLFEYPQFLDSLFDLTYRFDRLDASLRLLAFDTLGAVGSTNRAKRFLDQQHISMERDVKRGMNAFGVAIASGPLDLRVRHIDALAMMFEVRDGVEDTEADTIAQKWFSWLGEAFPSLIISYLSKPFNDIRISSLRLLLALFNHKWAIRIFYATAGFLVSILNRNTESNAEGKQCKYDVICKLIDSEDSMISPEDMIRLKIYRREGAFYVEGNPQIDMEND
uniref:26S proteasome non-ATPase regulatory subunit 5 n=1 Tax=Elaeophora elaphi TaxID=1147741 RepID=A0A0R3S582_9BILA